MVRRPSLGAARQPVASRARLIHHPRLAPRRELSGLCGLVSFCCFGVTYVLAVTGSAGFNGMGRRNERGAAMQVLETAAVTVAIDVELVDRAAFIFEGEVVASGQ